mmetsp:Transcript_31372/g.46272  ORF Transcript_31372/g.46272 Transcript_31372/m.46272 type:complete len:288 (+) Transcript_31372:102-965(+)
MTAILFLLLLPDIVAGFTQFSIQKKVNSNLLSSSALNLPEGLFKTISKEGSGDLVNIGDVATVKYSCYLPDSQPFARSDNQKVTIGSGEMIDGWEQVIKTMRIGERAVVRITDPSLGYGPTGVPPVVPPDAVIELDLEVLDAAARKDINLNIDFDTLAIGDPSTPRTAESISAAYDQLMEKKAMEPQKEGLEGMIETVKGWYFFGFFEGETGEEAPWFLKPSITFPIAFAIVGAAFYVSFIGGAITERGVQSTDELDEIILSMQTNPVTSLLAFALSGLLVSDAFVL